MDRKLVLIFLAILFICLIKRSSSNRWAGETNELNEDESSSYNSTLSKLVAKNVFDLSQRLTEKLLEQSTKKFEILSPISISAALHLAYLGANQQTYDELNRLLGYEDVRVPSYQIHREMSGIIEDLVSDIKSPDRPRDDCAWKQQFQEYFSEKMEKFRPEDIHHEIYVANGLFVQKGFSIRPSYRSAVQSVYQSELKELDFKNDGMGSSNYINRWVDDKTRGKIKEIVKSSTNPETKVILVNALYFKSLWMTPFQEGECCVRKFYPDGTDAPSIDVKLMPHYGNFPYYKDAECDVAVLGFPYQKGISTMYVFLPNKSSKSKLKAAQKCLTAEKVEQIIANLRDTVCVVLFPRLHLSSSFNLKSKLQELGLNTLFENGQSDFSLMADAGSTNKKVNNNNRNFRTNQNLRNQNGTELTRPWADNFNDLYSREIKFRSDFQDNSLKRIDELRNNGKNLRNPGLFADEVVHKVDLTINERGTEGGAATAISMARSSQAVFRVDSPFLLLVRHDPTRIPLFYGSVYEPVDDIKVNF